jgi:pyridoxal phosphate enzyme (YggS family)
MAVPGEGHEDVGDDEQNDGPHDILGCGKVTRGSVASTMTALNENLEQLEDAIAGACRNAGRARAEVELMAVSKTYPAATIAEAAALGLSLFGENRVQEFALKAPDLCPKRESMECGCPILSAPVAERVGEHNPQPARFRVHLIGHLQSNKALRAVELFDGIDSVDSLRLAERLNEAAGKLGKRLPILIEVKLSPEETKAGLDPESADAARLLERLPDLGNLETRGLMTIAPWGVPEAETRACFRVLKGWRERWAGTYPRINFDVLSMGMSGDFGLAIEEGATRIRIGTALFGKRGPYTGPA